MEIRRYIALLRTWGWLPLLAIIVSGSAAYIVSRNTTPIYRASARLLIDEAPGATSGNDYSQILLEQKLAATYVELLETRPILQKTIEELHLATTVERLASKISVSAPQDTQILAVSVEDSDPKRAEETANTLAKVFIEDNIERQSGRFSEVIENREEAYNLLREQVDQLEAEIDNFGAAETPEETRTLSELEQQLREAKNRATINFDEVERLSK